MNTTYIDIDDIVNGKDIKFIHDGVIYNIAGLGTEGLGNDKSIMISIDLHLRRVNTEEEEE